MTIGNENGFVKTQIEIPLDKMNYMKTIIIDDERLARKVNKLLGGSMK